MGANERMLSGYRLPSDNSTSLPAKLGLLEPRMNGLESVEPLLEGWRKTFICLYVVDKGRVTADFWSIQNDQESGSWWLLLVCHIRVPPYAAITIRQKCFKLSVAAISVDKVDLGVSFRGTTGRMNMVTAEVTTKIKSFLDWKVREILIPESNHFALSDEERKLILPSIAELAELNTSNFRASGRRELLDLRAICQEVWKGTVCV